MHLLLNGNLMDPPYGAIVFSDCAINLGGGAIHKEDLANREQG